MAFLVKKLPKPILFYLIVTCGVLLFALRIVNSQEFTSSNYKVLGPVMNAGGYGSSANFKLFGVVSQIAVGTSTSSTFGNNAGFLYFPFVTTPVVSATAGNAKVDLSWTSASAGVGWSVGSYSVGQSITSGGPYSYTNAGSGLSYTASNLTNGTTYYFVVRVIDGVGNPIATSTQVSGTPTAPPSGGGGGGGGGGGIITSVIFSGRAYPGSAVTLLKDAQIAATTVAGPDAHFQVNITGLSGGKYIFSVYSEDNAGRRSALLTFPITLTVGATTNISGIFLAPTISVDKKEVRRGDTLVIFGQSAPQSDITIAVNSAEELFLKTKTDQNGVYLYNFDTTPLERAQHFTKSKSVVGTEISPFSQSVGFIVGSRTVLSGTPTKCPAKADLNKDCRVNLIDFSIAAYWYKRTLSSDFLQKEKLLSSDAKVDLVDFSIMAYYWTG